MKKSAALILISTCFILADGLEWRAKPCNGKISEISTKNLIEYHPLQIATGDYVLACENSDGTLRISSESIAKIGRKTADKTISDYNTLHKKTK